MIDQATQLRNLALAAGNQAEPPVGAPRICAIVGGKGGVGVTTLAVNLAAALGAAKTRTVLLEAGPNRADVALLCGLEDGASLDEVLSSRLTLSEALQPAGPGCKVVVGAWASENEDEYGPAARQRLLRHVQGLGEVADQVLIDAANAADPLSTMLWQACDEALVVTTPDDLAVMDAYAMVKRLGNWPGTIGLLVNQCPDAAEAEDVYRRVDRSCRRFLGYGVARAGHVPSDPAVAEAAHRRQPLVRLQPDSPAALAVAHLAASLESHRQEPRKKQTTSLQGS